MSAPEGNQFWKLAPTMGRKKLWETPEDLQKACEEYFEKIVSTPLLEDTVISFQGHPTHVPMKKMRTMSIQGLCVFLGIARNTWRNYSEGKDEYEDFLLVTEYVEQVMYDYKLTGASAGLLNPSILARDLKLSDKIETDVTSGGKRIKNDWHIHPVSTKKGKDDD